MKIQSGFAILDVKLGRKQLLKEVEKRKIPVTIKGFITNNWSADDGESMEFEIDVQKVTLK